MTDSKTVVEDLAAWLTQIWDEDSDPFEVPHATACNSVMGGESGWGLRKCDCEIPARWLARIAAEQKIIKRLRALEDQQRAEWMDYAEWADGNNPPARRREFTHDELAEIPGLRAALRINASAYADRPGFRPEWLVERQGVEW